MAELTAEYVVRPNGELDLAEVRQTPARIPEVLLNSPAGGIVQGGFDGAHRAPSEGTRIDADLVLSQRPDLVAEHGTHQRLPNPTRDPTPAWS